VSSRIHISELPTSGAVSRYEFLSALLFVGCLNGLSWRAIESINKLGWRDALLDTFEISAIVWLACLLGFILIFSSVDRTEKITAFDLVVGLISLVLVFLPIGPLSWLAVTLVCIYLLKCAPGDDLPRRGAIILLATTVPMLWSRLVYRFFANFIVDFDATFVGWLLGTRRHGNVVEFADHSGNLVVMVPCSSLANVSLAFLCWVAATQFVKHAPSKLDALWCLAACASVVAVNVFRMAMMGLSQPVYAAFHSGLGEAIANALVSAIILACTAMGVRRELSHLV
jgi:hypothetical protein